MHIRNMPCTLTRCILDVLMEKIKKIIFYLFFGETQIYLILNIPNPILPLMVWNPHGGIHTVDAHSLVLISLSSADWLLRS